MKKGIIKTILFTFIFALILDASVYAVDYYELSSSEHNEGSTSAGSSLCRCRQEYYQGLSLKDVKVKFTQNDTEYIFDISAKSDFTFWGNELTNKDLCYVNNSDIPQPILYKTENFGNRMIIEEYSKLGFIDYYGSVYTNSVVTIKNQEIGYLYTSADVKPNTNDQTAYTKRNNGDKFFIPNEARINALANTHNYKNVKEYPYDLDNNGEGVRVIKNSSNKSYIEKEFDKDGNGDKTYASSVNIDFNTKIAIEKSSMDDYRYICFICSEVGRTSLLQKTGKHYSYGYSLSTNTIDLKNFIMCNHSWSVTSSDASNHTLKCANCEWVKTEAHDYKFAYDGILNDVCICSRVKQVKYHYEINDNFNTTIDKIMNTNSTCDKVEVQKKTGYNFKWYEKYELQFDDDDLLTMTTNQISAKKVFLNNTTKVDNMTGSRSIFYKAVYSPIKYVFNYSNKASVKDYIKKHLNKNISPQTFYYNSKDYLKGHSEYDYLTFKGWTLTEGSNKADFLSKAEILNYTSIDQSEFTLYPIYEPMEYKILYNTINGKYDGDTQQLSKVYDYYIDEDFVKPKDMGKNKAFSHYVDMNGNQFSDMNALRNFIKDEAGENQTVILFAMSKVVSDGNDDEKSISSQEYWNLNNNTDSRDDTGATNQNNNESNNKNNNGNGSSSSISSDVNNTSSNDSNESSVDNSTNSNHVDNSDNKNNNNSVNVVDGSKDTNNTNDSNDSNTSNRGSSYVSYSSGGSGSGGGSNNRPERIKSFPEDKYTGPGVINSLAGDKKADTKIGNLLNDSSLYLYNMTDQKKLSNDIIKNNNIGKNENLEKDEINEDIFGPPLIDFENDENYRGIHGPWYYEKKYVDRIIREKEERLKKHREEELKLEEKQKETNLRVIATLAFGLLFLILIITFEIFNIKLMKLKK